VAWPKIERALLLFNRAITRLAPTKVWEGKTQSGEIGDPVTMLELISLLRTLARLFRERRDLMVENLLLRHQLNVALCSHPRPDLKTRDRFFWILVRRLLPDWKQHLILVQPETVVRWHRQGWRLYWRWRSGHHLVRPRLSLEIRELIATMANENSLWDTERIRGELLKLGILVSSRSIRRYRRRRHLRPPSQSWRTFLANHAQAIWAADLFVVQTLTFQTLYVIFFINHGSRSSTSK
jgi:putative transposase